GFCLSKDFTPTSLEDGGVRDHSNNKSYDLQTKANFTLFDYHTLGLSAGYTFADVRNVPSSIYQRNYRQYRDVKRYQISGMMTLIPASFIVLYPQVYYDAYDNVYQEFSDFHLHNRTYDSIIKSWLFGSQIRSELVTSGKDKLYHLYRFEKQVYDRKDDREYTEWTSNHTYLNQTSAMLNHKFSEDWQSSIAIGFSQSIRNFHTPENTTESVTTDWYAEPSFALTFANSFTDINLGVSRNIQYPTLRQLYSNSRGNLRLLPERIWKTELSTGYKTLGDGLIFNLESSVFYNHIQGLIDRINSPIYQNQPARENAGFEVLQGCLLSNKVQIKNQLSYLKLDMNKGFTFTEMPCWTFDHTQEYYILPDLKFTYQIGWSDQIQSLDDGGSLHTLPDKTLHNIGVHWSINKHFKLALSMSNIFDIDYQEEYGYPAAGRDFSATVEIRN
ncbi:MAG: TonB-dependent receptor, partial [Candidatus Cloacimonetes bacterium]|nr:TonB-dependent receptor [Candidatus Cloacimonadota bacterium]